MPDPRRWKILGVLCLSLVVISLDNTILNVALPAIDEDLGASASELQWIVDSYLLSFAGLLLTAGSFGDRFGRKRVLTGGLLTFGLASAAASLMGDPGGLIACRAVMGVGSAAIMPSTLSILTAVFPVDERPKAIGIWSGMASLGLVIGPVAGGALVQHANWHWVFLVNVPIVVAALGLGHRLVPESRDARSPRLDLRGAALSIVGLCTLVWGIIEAPSRGWTDPVILAAFAVAAAVLVAFAVAEVRTRHPMLDVAFFRDPRFSASSAAISLTFFALSGTLFFLTQFLQSVVGLEPMTAGLWMTPIAAGLMLGAPQAPRLVERIGAKVIVCGGLLMSAVGLGLLAQATSDWGFWDVAIRLFVLGVGVGLALAPATDAIMGSLPLDHASVGSAVNDTNRIVGGALGVAVLGSILSSGYRSAMSDANPAITGTAAKAADDSVVAAVAVARDVGGKAGQALHNTATSAFVDAMGTASLVAAGVVVAGAVIAGIWLPGQPLAADGALAAPPADAPFAESDDEWATA